MGSFQRPKPSYNTDELRIPSLAFVGGLASAREMAWRTEVLKAAMRRQLLMIASEGITDPERVGAKTVKSNQASLRT